MTYSGQPREVRFNLGERSLAALEWGEAEKPLILALHGWLDNAASFSMLAPLLVDYRILALDLAGHGQSDWRSSDAGYPVWSYVEDLRRVHLSLSSQGNPASFSSSSAAAGSLEDKLSPVALLGHSLGAGVASLYAATWPASVSCVGLIENIGPLSGSDEHFVDNLRASLEHELADKPLPRARPFDAWVRSRVVSQFAVPLNAAERLMQRNTEIGTDGLYHFRCDPRLKNPSVVRLTEAQVQGALRQITAPVKLISGATGLKRPMTRERIECVSYLAQIELPGGHHLHMEENSVYAVAEQLALFYAELIK